VQGEGTKPSTDPIFGVQLVMTDPIFGVQLVMYDSNPHSHGSGTANQYSVPTSTTATINPNTLEMTRYWRAPHLPLGDFPLRGGVVAGDQDFQLLAGDLLPSAPAPSPGC